MKRIINILLISLILLVGCDNHHCPLCGETDSIVKVDTIDKDIATPILLKYGEEVTTEDAVIIAYRHDALLRQTQQTKRTIEYCSSCGNVLDCEYETIYYKYNNNVKYSKTKSFVESIENGKLIAVIHEGIGAIIY